jgi:pimeloyl-ACP methyl ester carboxylesterase
VTAYDEFGLLEGNAREHGLPWSEPPRVERRGVEVGDGQSVSAILWGEGPAEVLFLHGGAQNAHTWDTVNLALDRPAVCVDLPGHGHSDWRDDRDYGPERNAEAMAVALRALAPAARLVVGMSLGGLTSSVLAARWPELVRELVLIDVTPGVNAQKARAIADFVRGPEFFASFEEILERTITHNPTRSADSLRRGVLHNARPLPDGRWTWRYDRRFRVGDATSTAEGTAAHASAPEPVEVNFRSLWDHISQIEAPLSLLRGALSPVVDDEDVAELQRRQPGARVEVIEGAGHSIQGDRPLELARILDGLLSK